MEVSGDNNEKILLPHHKQQSLCTTRLPYRRGRKLTAVKVYTINNESNHLLIFGVPSLSLRQECKSLFLKFGKLKAFNLTTEYKCEQFTETYHAVFENIHAARAAKRMVDTKNFYGGSLHVTYAPELENLEETESKLTRRKLDVLARLRYLKKEEILPAKTAEVAVEVCDVESVIPKLNMGEENVIKVNGVVKKRKYKQDVVEEKRFKSCFMENNIDCIVNTSTVVDVCSKSGTEVVHNEYSKSDNKIENDIEIIDCTSTNVETITNINEHLNVDKFDNIKIYKVPEKPVNKIKFNLIKKS